MYNVCLCAWFQFDPRESHPKDVKSILRYLVGTTNQSLYYKKNQDFKLVIYYDADYAADRVEKKKHKWWMSLYWTLSNIMGK